MNPQFVRTFHDLKRVREEYMNNLELQISNDLYNQNLNETYQATGQVPIDPTKNMLGFYDFQQLKQQLKKALLEIMNDTDRAKTVELLAQQPQEMLFALGEMKTLISYFKPLYRRTVPYIIFVSYVRNLIKKTFRVNAFDARLQSSNTSSLEGQTKTEAKGEQPQMKDASTQKQRDKPQMKDASTQLGMKQSGIRVKPQMKDASTGSFIYNERLYPTESNIAVVEDSDDDNRSGAKVASARKRVKQVKADRIEKVIQESKKRRTKNVMERRGIRVVGKGMGTTDLLPFGKYALNTLQLHKQKLGLKTRNNNAVKKYPVQNVSQDVAHILTSIGYQEAFDVSTLDDNDKSFLYELLDYAEVPVNLPRQKGAGHGEAADCKDKDLHRFELLKGQVLAGNNAKEVVDELKLLIVKLINEDRIVRKQGQNLLTDLVSLGY